jgi:hypothetical protein
MIIITNGGFHVIGHNLVVNKFFDKQSFSIGRCQKIEVGLDIKCISNDYWIIDSNQIPMQYKMKKKCYSVCTINISMAP